MIGFQIFAPFMKADPVTKNAGIAAGKLGASYANYFRLSLVNSKKIATGKTLRGVKDELTIYSPSRGIYRRQVTAPLSWQYIQGGRAAGKKMPIRFSGGKFEPVPELLEWFRALNIPQAAWWPILRKIARDGIRPVNIRDKAMRDAEPRFQSIVAQLARDLEKDIPGAMKPITQTFRF